MDILQYIERAQSALKQGEYDLATQYFQLVLNRNPENAEALQGLKQIEIVRTKGKLNPLNRELNLIKGWILMKFGKAAAAYPGLEILFRCLPDHPRIALAFARCAEASERYGEAAEAYQRILARDDENKAVLKAAAEVLIKLDRLEEAASLYQRLLAISPNNEKVVHRLRDISAQAYARIGIPENLKERRAAIEKQKREAPAPPEIMEQVEGLLREYQKDPANQELGVQIAAKYRAGGIFSEANKILGPILDRDPQYVPARREQARVWRQSHELEIAVNLYEELLAESPHDAALRDEYLEASIALMEKRLQDGQARPDGAARLEKLRIEHSKNRISLLKRILSEHPEAFEERFELGSLLYKTGRAEEAIPVLQRLVHEPGWAGKGLFLLGQCFRAKGDKTLALLQFEKAVEFFKNRGYSHVLTEELKALYYNMGVVKDELGDKTGAREAYGQVYSQDINYRDVRSRYENLYG
ncbi:MAG: tetratricopeptide repeat protein [bacterium]